MVLPLFGFMFGLAYSIGTGVLILSRVRKIGLTRTSLFAFVSGSFVGAIGFGWIYTEIATHEFGDSWPGAWELVLLAGMGIVAVLVGYATAKILQPLFPSSPRQKFSRDLEGPVREDSDWY